MRSTVEILKIFTVSKVVYNKQLLCYYSLVDTPIKKGGVSCKPLSTKKVFDMPLKRPYYYVSGKAAYPWADWFKNKKFKLRRGKEFLCKTHCMNVLVRGAARNRNLQVSICVEEGDVLVVTLDKPLK